MVKVIEIDGKKLTFKSSAAIPRIYRLKFKRDIFVDLNKIKKAVDAQRKLAKEKAEDSGNEDAVENEEVLESSLPPETLDMFENIAFLMNRHGDPSQPNNIDDWLDQFEMFDIYKVLPEILDLWGEENLTSSSLKKNNAI